MTPSSPNASSPAASAAQAAQPWQAVSAQMDWQRGLVQTLDVFCGRVVAKHPRPPRPAALYHLLNAAAAMLRLPCLRSAPVQAGAAGQALEVRRLRALHAAGVRVPQVLHEGRDHFFIQWLGAGQLADMLAKRSPHALALWREAGDDLLRAHAAGQCMSHAVARNIVVDVDNTPPQLAGWIDFEDDPVQVMPLADAQVRDWLNYLFSTAGLLSGHASAVDAAVVHWLSAESAAVRQGFEQVARRLAWLRALPTHPRWGRDTVALQAAAAAVHRYICTVDARHARG